MVRILLVDDDTQLGAMLKEYLAEEGFETDIAVTGEAGLEALKGGAYAAVILDIMLPRMTGAEVLRRVRMESRIPIIMLTAKGDDVDRVVGLEMGADDYLAKPCYPRELVARLRAVLRRSQEQPPAEGTQALSNEDLRLFPQQRRAQWQGQPLDLTASEFNMLEILMRAGDCVVSKDELSLKVLGRAREPYDRSIDVHMSNLRQKLAAAAEAGAGMIETVRGIGYRMRRG